MICFGRWRESAENDLLLREDLSAISVVEVAPTRRDNERGLRSRSGRGGARNGSSRRTMMESPKLMVHELT